MSDKEHEVYVHLVRGGLTSSLTAATAYPLGTGTFWRAARYDELMVQEHRQVAEK